MKTRFIVNLRSGRAARAINAVNAFAAQRGADVVLTERARHAHDLARAALDDGYGLIVAVGGDGTMNEIASALVDTPATLGLIPCGSGDGLGRHLGIHGSTAHALHILDHGRPRLIDTGMANDHPFFTAAGVGFEADIAQKFNQLQHRGFLRYLSTSVRAFRHWQPQRYIITHAGGREELRAFTLAVTNADQYGNNAIISPGARVDDGLLNLTAIPPVTFLNGVPLVCRLFTGSLDRQSGVIIRRADHLILERSAPGPLHTDGEIHEAADAVIEFTIRPASLRIMVPGGKS